MYNNIINNKKNRIRLMRRVVLFIRDIGIFKYSYSWWADSIMANASCRRHDHPGSIPGPSTAKIELFGGKNE